MRVLERLTAALVAGLVGVVVVAGGPALPAAAHNSLRSTDPADGQVLERLPAAVTLTFDEPAIALGTEVLVTGPGGNVAQGSPRLVDDTVSQDLVANGPSGRYVVAWRVTSADGHPITGSFGFSTRTGSAAPSGAPAPAPASSAAAPGSSTPGGNRDIPGWAWVLTVVVAVVALGSIGYHLRQRSRQG